MDRLSNIYSNILKKNGADVYNERAEFIDKNTVMLTSSKKKISANTILIAVGGQPWSPDIPGVEHAIISDDAFVLEQREVLRDGCLRQLQAFPDLFHIAGLGLILDDISLTADNFPSDLLPLEIGWSQGGIIN